MTSKQKQDVTGIITTAATAAALVSGVSSQIPLADNVILSGIEITMTIEIGKVFGRDISRSIAWSIVLSQIGTISGKAISQVLIGWIPGIGNITNGATSLAVVEALGWSIVDYFEYSYEKEGTRV